MSHRLDHVIGIKADDLHLVGVQLEFTKREEGSTSTVLDSPKQRSNKVIIVWAVILDEFLPLCGTELLNEGVSDRLG